MKQFLEGSQGLKGDVWEQGASRICEIPKYSRMLWESENDEVQDSWGVSGISEGLIYAYDL